MTERKDYAVWSGSPYDVAKEIFGRGTDIGIGITEDKEIYTIKISEINVGRMGLAENMGYNGQIKGKVVMALEDSPQREEILKLIKAKYKVSDLERDVSAS